MKKLISEIEERRTNFKTESYSMSIGELIHLYEEGELIIRPEYQRLFRWTHSQKVKLVESIILGIPVPSIFVYQDESGVWELVDGLQRVSTILQFFGVLKKEEPLVMEATKHIPSFEGICWKNSSNPEKELPPPLKLSFKRAKIDLTIILSESDVRAKFEVFQRLNTGGSNASKQEIRNSVMIMIDIEKYNWFKELTDDINFIETLSLSDRLLDEQYHMELMLRFIAITNFDYNSKKDVGDFLDEISDKLIFLEASELEKIKNNASEVFRTLNKVLGEKVFKKFSNGNFKGKFLESAFEAICVGLSENILSYTNGKDEVLLATKIKELYLQEKYITSSGSGSNAKQRIPKLVPFSKEYFKK